MATHSRRLPPKLDAEGNKVPRQWPKIIDGVKFGSPLEHYTYQQLEQHNVKFEFQKKYVFIKPFKYGGESVPGISLTVDFYLPEVDIIVDPKGLQDPANIIKWKMLKRMLISQGKEPRMVFLTSHKAVREFIYMLHNGFTQVVKESALKGRISKLKKVTKMSGDRFYGNNGRLLVSLSALREMTDYDFNKILNHLQKQTA